MVVVAQGLYKGAVTFYGCFVCLKLHKEMCNTLTGKLLVIAQVRSPLL